MDLLLNQFLENHPKLVASILEDYPENEFMAFINQVDEQQGTFFSYLSTARISFLLKNDAFKHFDFVIKTISDVQLALALKGVEESKKNTIFQNMSPTRSIRVRRILTYNELQVGYHTYRPSLILFNDETVLKAQSLLSNSRESDLPIFLVNRENQFLGTLDLVQLIQKRDQLDLELSHLISKDVKSIKASLPLKYVLDGQKWDPYIPIGVTDNENRFLGVISVDRLKQRFKTPIQKIERSAVEEYFSFIEILWVGLSRFWGTLK